MSRVTQPCKGLFLLDFLLPGLEHWEKIRSVVAGILSLMGVEGRMGAVLFYICVGWH